MILVFLITLEAIEAVLYSCYNTPLGDNKTCFMRRTDEGKYSPIDYKFNSKLCGNHSSQAAIRSIHIVNGKVVDLCYREKFCGDDINNCNTCSSFFIITASVSFKATALYE